MTDPHTIGRSLSPAQRRAVLLLDREWTFLGLHNLPSPPPETDNAGG